MKIYDFKVKDINNKEVSLSDYEGKVLLIVNGATGCGFTPQYDGIQNLYDKYKDQGFEVLDFPSNQFLEQAPGTNEEIVGFCKLNFGVNFTQFGKIEVNGENEEPLYNYLKSVVYETRNDATLDFYSKVAEFTPGIAESDIRWNFTKFLVNRDGNVIARFAPTITPDEIENYVVDLLNENNDIACSPEFTEGCK